MAGDQRIILGKNKAGDSSGLYVTKSGLDYFGNDSDSLPVATTANDLLFDSDLSGQSVQVYQRGTFSITCEQIPIINQTIRSSVENIENRTDGDTTYPTEQWMIDLLQNAGVLGSDSLVLGEPYILKEQSADYRNLDTGSVVIDLSNSNIPPGTNPEIVIRFAVGNSQTGEIHPWYAKNTGADATGSAGLYSDTLGGDFAPSHPTKIERMDSAWHRFKYNGGIPMGSAAGQAAIGASSVYSRRDSAFNSNLGTVGVIYYATDTQLVVNAFMTPTYSMGSRSIWNDIMGRSPWEVTTQPDGYYDSTRNGSSRMYGGFPRGPEGWFEANYHTSFFNPFSDNKTGRVTPHGSLSRDAPLSFHDFWLKELNASGPIDVSTGPLTIDPIGDPGTAIYNFEKSQHPNWGSFPPYTVPHGRFSYGNLIGLPLIAHDWRNSNLHWAIAAAGSTPFQPTWFAVDQPPIGQLGQIPGDPLYDAVISAQTFFQNTEDIQTGGISLLGLALGIAFNTITDQEAIATYAKLEKYIWNADDYNIDKGDDEIGLLGAGSLASLNGGTVNLASMVAAGDTPNSGWDTYHCSYMVYSFGVAETAASPALAEATYNINFDEATLQNSAKRDASWKDENHDPSLSAQYGYNSSPTLQSGDWGFAWKNESRAMPYYRNLVFPDDFVGTVGDPATDPFAARRGADNKIIGNVQLNISTMGPGNNIVEQGLYGSDEWDFIYHRPKPAITFDFSSDKWDLENNPEISLFIDNYGYVFGGGGAGGFGGRISSFLTSASGKGGGPYFQEFLWYPGGGGGAGGGSGGNPDYHVGGSVAGLRTYEGVGFGGKGYGFWYTVPGPPSFVSVPDVGGDGEMRRGYEFYGTDPGTGPHHSSEIIIPTFAEVNDFGITPVGVTGIHTGSDGGDAIGIIVDPTNNENGNISVEIHNDRFGLVAGGGGGGGGGRGSPYVDGGAGDGGRLGYHGHEGYTADNDPTIGNAPVPPYDDWRANRLNLFAFGGNPGYVIASLDRNWLGVTQLQTTWQQGVQQVHDLGALPYTGTMRGREPDENLAPSHDYNNSGGSGGATYRIGNGGATKTRFVLGEYSPNSSLGALNNGTRTITYQIIKAT